MFLYNIGIYLYALAVRLASPFKRKAKVMLQGHKEVFDILEKKIDPAAQYIWFHAASVGEFEQGRPIMEEVKKEYPQYKILLSFFSPSGFDSCAGFKLADVVCYLPFDKKRQVRKFLKLANPQMAIFIKYEFWYNYMKELNRLNVPTYLISAIFRPSQIFFKWYGYPMRKILHLYKMICLQDEDSKKLLQSIGVVDNVKVCGDTRFDRVIAIREQSKELSAIKKFADIALTENEKILVAGSSWPKDEDVFIPYFNLNTELKLIVAPHEIDDAHLKYIESTLMRPYIRLSEAVPENIDKYDCIIIDSYGLLSSVYRYGNIAYIGGGFGTGIHNLLEAAVYGIPVVFGPNFKKFREAQHLIERGGGYSIGDADSFRILMDEFIQYEDSLSVAGLHAKEYVYSTAGVVDKVMNIIFRS